LPFTPNTVTVTSLPIITVSPTRLVNINIIQLLAMFALAAAKITALHTASRQAFVRESNGGSEVHTGILRPIHKNTRIPNVFVASSENKQSFN
jgi:hypothetical protein